jgi:hypothetical protein
VVKPLNLKIEAGRQGMAQCQNSTFFSDLKALSLIRNPGIGTNVPEGSIAVALGGSSPQSPQLRAGGPGEAEKAGPFSYRTHRFNCLVSLRRRRDGQCQSIGY